ncbi:putative racemase YgeA [bioreactor metagenome]|uniref:Putative racemase YgeA n=1 Tax=bioreactor metagenome TaxID=1076179 RepID=A0A645FI29_9ZZZZ
MEQTFYKKALQEEGLEVQIPTKEERKELVRIVDEELTHGRILSESLERFWQLAELWQQQGAEGIVLGCTEIGLLVQKPRLEMAIFDTALIHAAKAVELALGTEEQLKYWDDRR